MRPPDQAASPGRSAAEVRAAVDAFLAEHTSLVLATTGVSGEPAAAAVFYAFEWDRDAPVLYYLSEERTVHGRNVLANPAVAAAIQADGQDWRAIRGLQMRGTAGLVSPAQLPHATAIYGRRFGFVAALLAGRKGPAVLTGPLAKARFWFFRPGWLRLIDNTIRFGYKDELTLDRPA